MPAEDNREADETLPMEDNLPDSTKIVVVEATQTPVVEEVIKIEAEDVPSADADIVELYREPEIPDPSQGRKRTNPSPVSKQVVSEYVVLIIRFSLAGSWSEDFECSQKAVVAPRYQ